MDDSMRQVAIAFKEGQDLTIDRLSKAIHDQGERIIQRIDVSQQDQKTKEERDRDQLLQQKFFESLVFPEIFRRQDSVKQAYVKTYRWIFDRSGTKVRPWDNFIEWLETGSSTYWINGKAGSGKSTLMRFIYQDPCTTEALHTWAAGKELLMPAFFFWAAGTKLEHSVEGFLRSVIVHLLKGHESLIPRLSQLESRLSSISGMIYAWTEERLLRCLEILVDELSSECRICLFADGLDELSGEYEPLIKLIQKLVSSPHFKCCFSSRPENEFQIDFKYSSQLKLQDLTHEDIRSYVEAKLEEFDQLQRIRTKEGKIWQNVINTIVNKADGVFLWVELVVNGQKIGFKNKDPPELLLKRLHSLPKTIEELYCSMLGKIEDLYREEAAWFMQMALHCSNNSTWPTDSYSRPSICDYAVAKYGLDKSLHVSCELTAENIALRCRMVYDRIMTTCGGFLEVCGNPDRLWSDDFSEPDGISESDQSNELAERGEYGTLKFLMKTDKWLSWESDSGRTAYEGPDWSDIPVQFSHRTAKDFIEKSEAGQLFLKACRNWTRYPSLLDSAVHAVYVTICRRRNKQMYMCKHAFWLMVYARKAAREPEVSLHSLMAVIENFEKQIQSLFLQFQPTKNDLHWCQYWFVKPSLMEVDCHYGYVSQRGKNFPVKGDPDDFLSLCAVTGVLWYVEEKLKAFDISPSKASQLAVCCGLKLLLGIPDWDYDYYHTGTQLALLETLVRLGADPTVGVSVSLWEIVLGSFYMAAIWNRKGYMSVINAFLQAGACKDQRFILDLPRRRTTMLFSSFKVEVNIRDLPLRCRHGEDTHGKATEKDISVAKPDREKIWVGISRRYKIIKDDEARCGLWLDKSYEMSASQTGHFVRLLQDILDRSEPNDFKLGEALEAWLEETFMDDCGLCKISKEREVY